MNSYFLEYRTDETMLCSEVCEQKQSAIASFDDLGLLGRPFLEEQVVMILIIYAIFSVKNNNTRFGLGQGYGWTIYPNVR